MTLLIRLLELNAAESVADRSVCGGLPASEFVFALAVVGDIESSRFGSDISNAACSTSCCYELDCVINLLTADASLTVAERQNRNVRRVCSEV